jgi:hypothetical protein
MNTKEFIEIATSLPIEERILVLDQILKSMNEIDPEMEKEWIEIADKRWLDIKSGKTQGVDGQEVFKKMWNKFK